MLTRIIQMIKRAKYTLASFFFLLLMMFGSGFVVEWLGGLERFQEEVLSAGAWAPIIFILVRAAIFVAAPLSSLPLELWAGNIFGIWNATFYTLLGSVIGGSVNFWLARVLGRPAVTRIIGKSGMDRVHEFTLQIGGWRSLFLARIFLPAIYDFISYACGFTRLPYPVFLLTTLIGGIVPSFLWVSFGVVLVRRHDILVVVSIGMILFYVAGLIVIRHWKSNSK